MKSSSIKPGQKQHKVQHYGLLGLGFQRGLQQRDGMVCSQLPPKGWMVIRVGEEGGEQQRFLVPVGHLNHPLFQGLLKEAEDEYGFEHKGVITIPCHVEHFFRVQGIIIRDNSCNAAAAAASHHFTPLHLICFRALS